MSSSTRYPVIGSRVIRVTKEDACGTPAFGDEVYSVCEGGYASIAPTANWNDGTEISLVDADARESVYRSARPFLRNISLAIVFNRVDPSIYTAITGKVPIRNRASGEIVGWRTDRTISPHDVRWGLEAWSDAFEDGCTEDGDLQYAYFGWPTITGGKVTDVTIENNAVTFGINDARTANGSGWGVGAFNVDTDDMGDPAPLETAVGPNDHDIFLITTLAPPTDTGGFLPLDDPEGVAATTATAGTPGVWNGTRPANLTALLAGTIAGSGGATPWATGAFVYLGDGSKAHWAGSGATPKWVAGPA